MAKGKPRVEDDEDDEVAAPKKSKLTLVIVILLVLILLGGGGGFAYWFFAVHGKAPQGASVAVQAQPEGPPTYTALEPFTVNLKDPGVALQTAITLKVHDEKVDAKVKERMPEVRDQILLLLANQQSASLMTTAGKESLGSQIALAVNKVLGAKTPNAGVSKVLFTSFIIQ